jgi:hypothetical protein
MNNSNENINTTQKHQYFTSYIPDISAHQHTFSNYTDKFNQYMHKYGRNDDSAIVQEAAAVDPPSSLQTMDQNPSVQTVTISVEHENGDGEE